MVTLAARTAQRSAGSREGRGRGAATRRWAPADSDRDSDHGAPRPVGACFPGPLGPRRGARRVRRRAACLHAPPDITYRRPLSARGLAPSESLPQAQPPPGRAPGQRPGSFCRHCHRRRVTVSDGSLASVTGDGPRSHGDQPKITGKMDSESGSDSCGPPAAALKRT